MQVHPLSRNSDWSHALRPPRLRVAPACHCRSPLNLNSQQQPSTGRRKPPPGTSSVCPRRILRPAFDCHLCTRIALHSPKEDYYAYYFTRKCLFFKLSFNYPYSRESIIMNVSWLKRIKILGHKYFCRILNKSNLVFATNLKTFNLIALKFCLSLLKKKKSLKKLFPHLRSTSAASATA